MSCRFQSSECSVRGARWTSRVDRRASCTRATYLTQVRKAWCEEAKLHRVKEVGFAAAIAPHNGIGPRGKGLHFSLLSKGPKVANCNLFNVHGGG